MNVACNGLQYGTESVGAIFFDRRPQSVYESGEIEEKVVRK